MNPICRQKTSFDREKDALGRSRKTGPTDGSKVFHKRHGSSTVAVSPSLPGDENHEDVFLHLWLSHLLLPACRLRHSRLAERHLCADRRSGVWRFVVSRESGPQDAVHRQALPREHSVHRLSRCSDVYANARRVDDGAVCATERRELRLLGANVHASRTSHHGRCVYGQRV